MDTGTPARTALPATARGALISVEGLNGVGKTYLTEQALADVPPEQRPWMIEEFSRRNRAHTPVPDLGRALLRTLVGAADGDPFLRSGHPGSETLMLLAIKTHDYETCRPVLRAGRSVVEGRSAHSVAVYQSLILEPGPEPGSEWDDDRAAARARSILATAATWRPLPDLTILITDDPGAAVGRAERRDRITYTAEQWTLHRRAAALFQRLADEDTDHVRVLDRRGRTPSELQATLRAWIAGAPRRDRTA